MILLRSFIFVNLLKSITDALTYYLLFFYTESHLTDNKSTIYSNIHPFSMADVENYEEFVEVPLEYDEEEEEEDEEVEQGEFDLGSQDLSLIHI